MSTRVAAARTSYLLITPIRLALGVLVLCVALVEGAADDNGLAAFALGAVLAAFAILSDRRALLLRRQDPEPLPDDARFVEHWRAAWYAAVPSTVGVAVLSVIA